VEYLVPGTWKKIHQRDRFFRMQRYLPPLRHLFAWMATRTATAIDLPDYPEPSTVDGFSVPAAAPVAAALESAKGRRGVAEAG
jgi:hypothetical protein